MEINLKKKTMKQFIDKKILDELPFAFSSRTAGRIFNKKYPFCVESGRMVEFLKENCNRHSRRLWTKKRIDEIEKTPNTLTVNEIKDENEQMYINHLKSKGYKIYKTIEI